MAFNLKSINITVKLIIVIEIIILPDSTGNCCYTNVIMLWYSRKMVWNFGAFKRSFRMKIFKYLNLSSNYFYSFYFNSKLCIKTYNLQLTNLFLHTYKKFKTRFLATFLTKFLIPHANYTTINVMHVSNDAVEKNPWYLHSGFVRNCIMHHTGIKDLMKLSESDRHEHCTSKYDWRHSQTFIFNTSWDHHSSNYPSRM